nr:NUDIX domain-containing protein [Dermacoccus nishinomiyaensis]
MQPTFSAGAVAIIEHDGRVLALRQAHRSGWSLPGGLIDAGEHRRTPSCVRCVRRRASTSSRAASWPLISTRRSGTSTSSSASCDERPEVEVASEALESGWFALDELPHPDKSTRRIQRAVRLARQPSSVGVSSARRLRVQPCASQRSSPARRASATASVRELRPVFR